MKVILKAFGSPCPGGVILKKEFDSIPCEELTSFHQPGMTSFELLAASDDWENEDRLVHTSSNGKYFQTERGSASTHIQQHLLIVGVKDSEFKALYKDMMSRVSAEFIKMEAFLRRAGKKTYRSYNIVVRGTDLSQVFLAYQHALEETR